MRTLILLAAVLALIPGETSTASTDPVEYSDVPWQYLETLVGHGPRNPGSPGYRRTRNFLLEAGKTYADEVVVQPFTHQSPGRGTVSLANIELRFGAGGPPILIGAHYDTRPFADEEADPARRRIPIIGANDGGSGTAILLTLARYLHDNPPKRSVRLVFFDGEDYGAKGSSEYLLGSSHYARRLNKRNPVDWPFAVLVVDMVGDKDLQIFKENHSLKNAPWLVALIYRVARGKNGFEQFMEKSRYTMLDDHYPFLKRGIPAALLIDFDYPHWHTQDDTLDKCSPESLYTVFKVLADTLAELKAFD